MDDLAKLDADLGKVAASTLPAARAVVAKGAVNIKTQARQLAGGLQHAPAYPASITYDEYTVPGVVGAEIGPDKEKRQGALGNVLEFGTVNNPPHPHLRPAAEAEEPRFIEAVADLGVELLERGL